MENFQRYFLIACVFIMSYFLIIRWDSPSNIPSNQEVKTEVSTYSQKEEFGFIDKKIQKQSEEIISSSVSSSCVSSSVYEIDSNNWKISIDLEDGSLIKSELKKYPDEVGSKSNKLMFDACGRNEYSQLSGFVFGENAKKDFSAFKVEDIERSTGLNSYTFVRESSSLKESKIISFEPENYLIQVRHTGRNLTSEAINSSS